MKLSGARMKLSGARMKLSGARMKLSGARMKLSGARNFVLRFPNGAFPALRQRKADARHRPLRLSTFASDRTRAATRAARTTRQISSDAVLV